jgi:hypothetical protein
MIQRGVVLTLNDLNTFKSNILFIIFSIIELSDGSIFLLIGSRAPACSTAVSWSRRRSIQVGKIKYFILKSK